MREKDDRVVNWKLPRNLCALFDLTRNIFLWCSLKWKHVSVKLSCLSGNTLGSCFTQTLLHIIGIRSSIPQYKRLRHLLIGQFPTSEYSWTIYNHVTTFALLLLLRHTVEAKCLRWNFFSFISQTCTVVNITRLGITAIRPNDKVNV